MAAAIPTSGSSDIWEEIRSHVPENYQLKRALSIKTASSDLDIRESPLTERHLSIPLFALQAGSDIFRLQRPISVKIYNDEEWVFAENEALNLIGTGTTPQEAISDLQQHIIHFWNYYSDIPDESLTTDALQLKRIYSDRFVVR